MGLNTGSSTNNCVGLDLYEGTNETIIFDYAAIKVSRPYNGHILPKIYIEDANSFKIRLTSSHLHASDMVICSFSRYMVKSLIIEHLF